MAKQIKKTIKKKLPVKFAKSIMACAIVNKKKPVINTCDVYSIKDMKHIIIDKNEKVITVTIEEVAML